MAQARERKRQVARRREPLAARPRQGITLGTLLRRRRRQLEMTQAEVAAKVGCRPNYIGYLEADTRRPSPSVVLKLARALDLDGKELFLLSNPVVRDLLAPREEPRGSTWERFRANKRLHTRYGITRAELAALKAISSLGSVRTQRDYLFILQAIRQALADD